MADTYKMPAILPRQNKPSKPYIPPPSIGHEMGIMFGFIAIMLLSMLAYGFAWQIGNKRSAKKEAERIQMLRQSGVLKEEIEAKDIARGGEKTEVVS